MWANGDVDARKVTKVEGDDITVKGYKTAFPIKFFQRIAGPNENTDQAVTREDMEKFVGRWWKHDANAPAEKFIDAVLENGNPKIGTETTLYSPN